jgi:hypothetical protein
MPNGPCIVVKCPECGEQRVSPQSVTVRCCVDSGGGWSYRFTCPTCGKRAVGASLVSALMNALEFGAHLESWSTPAEFGEPHDGPLFTASEELDLHLLLLEPDWFDELCRCGDLDT